MRASSELMQFSKIKISRHGKSADLTKVCLRLECLSKTYVWYSIQSPLTTTTTTTRMCTWMSVQDPLLRSITSAKPGLCSARGTTEMKYLRVGYKREVSFLGLKDNINSLLQCYRCLIVLHGDSQGDFNCGASSHWLHSELFPLKFPQNS